MQTWTTDHYGSQYTTIYNWIIMDHCGPPLLWTIMVHYGLSSLWATTMHHPYCGPLKDTMDYNRPFWTTMSHNGPPSTVDYYGPLWAIMNYSPPHYGPLRLLYIMDHIALWAIPTMDHSRILWITTDHYGPWTAMHYGPWQTIMDHYLITVEHWTTMNHALLWLTMYHSHYGQLLTTS